MRIFLILIISICIVTKANAQNKKSISISELLKISEKSDFKGLVSLVHQLSYVVLDSSKEEQGSLVYIAREFKTKGNILSCNILPNKTMSILDFYTEDS